MPSWLADAGGKGIQLVAVAHGEAQLRTRWGIDGSRVVLDTCDVKIMLPGITDTATLRMASDLCGQAALKERGEDWITRQDVMTPDMIRQLPAGFALIVRGGCAPVVAKLGAAWRDSTYKNARQRGELVAALTAPPDLVVPDRLPEWVDADPPPDLEAADEFGDFDPDDDFPWS